MTTDTIAAWHGAGAGLDRIAAHYGKTVRGKTVRLPCPAHGGTGPNLELRAGDDRIGAVCYSARCGYRDIAAAIERDAGVRLSPGIGPRRPTSPRAALTPVAQGGQNNCKTAARSLVAAPPGTPLPSPEMLAAYANRRGWRLTGPVALHPYCWADGSTALVLARFPTPEGKQPRRLAWAGPRWRFGGTAGAGAVPLYRLPELLASPGQPALLVEGEKTADAVAVNPALAGYVPTATLGGCSPAGGTDWEPLRGRRVLVLGDADAAGQRFSDRAAALARDAGADVGVLRPSDVWALLGGTGIPPSGWDLADGVTDCGCSADSWLDRAAVAYLRGRFVQAERWIDLAGRLTISCRTPEVHADRLTRAAGLVASEPPPALHQSR